jgi:hypothetical protein
MKLCRVMTTPWYKFRNIPPPGLPRWFNGLCTTSRFIRNGRIPAVESAPKDYSLFTAQPEAPAFVWATSGSFAGRRLRLGGKRLDQRLHLTDISFSLTLIFIF